ncbi:MAG: hypothetical protein KDK91_16965 [Gammaproteobacteria bacterium]|nr:hypothetical protein [Gammaproteobacteria bacterium]
MSNRSASETTTAPSSATGNPRGRWVLIGLFALFFAPILLAYVLNVFRPDWLPFGQVNRGTLYDPAIQLEGLAPLEPMSNDPEAVHKLWNLVYLGSMPCEQACLAAQNELRKVIPALGRRAERAQAIWVLPSQPDASVAASSDPRFLPRYVVSGGLERLLSASPAPTLLVVDPRRYAVLHYPIDTPASPVLKDLERLLRISKIEQ